MSVPRSFILGTAGHVDHGKTSLVKALTGKDTDRLIEEHRRGISIELGFSHLELPNGVRLGIVDVPGHERFVRQMVAGAGGMDLAILLVAADEGVMPQTREHLDVLKLLGVPHGLVVLTKIDLVDDEELREVVAEEVAELVEGSFLEAAPVVQLSSATGEGLDELRDALVELTDGLPGRTPSGDFRLPVDRIFVLEGTGVVVTGTAWSGSVHSGDKLLLLPEGRELRVREVQSHDSAVDTGHAGERVALALHGIKKDEFVRGDVVVTPGAWEPTDRVGVELCAVAELDKPIKQRARVHVHHAAREVLGRIDLLEANELSPGETMLARLHLEEPLIAAPGDRLVIRSYSPMYTIAGGRVLDPFAPPRQRRADALERLNRYREAGRSEYPFVRIVEAGLVGLPRREVEALGRLAGIEAGELVASFEQRLASGGLVLQGDRLVCGEASALAAERVLAMLRDHQEREPLSPGVPREELRRTLGFAGNAQNFAQLLSSWSRDRPIFLVEDRVRADSATPELSGEQSAEVQALADSIAKAEPLFEATDAQLRSPEMALLVSGGRVVKIAGRLVADKASLDRLVERCAAHFATNDELAVAHLKEWTGASRKFVVPLLEWLDANDITRFDGGARSQGDACPPA